VAEATLLRGEHDTATMDRRLGCLERRRDQLGALAEILARADAAVVQHALDAAFALPAAETCATSDLASIPALPASSDLRARVRTAERAAAEATLRYHAGQGRVAEEIVMRALPEVRKIPHPRTEAELLLVDADCKQDRGDPRKALESSEAAFHAAQRASDDALAAGAAARIAHVSSSSLDKPQDGERWIKVAEAIAERTGQSDVLDEVLASRIAVNAATGHPELNLELHDNEVALLERLHSQRDPRVARAIVSRGITKYFLGKFEPALVDIQAGIALLTAVAGPIHPHLALDYTNLGAVFMALGRPSDAKEAYEHALALEADAPSGARTLTTYGALAEIENAVGSPDRAIEVAERGLDKARAAGEKGTLEWVLRLAIARAKGKKNDFAGEAQDCRAILAAQKAAGALSHDTPYAPDALTCLGEAELDLQHVEVALPLLEESVTYQLRIEQGDLPLARFALAQALRIAGRTPVRARELAENARDDLAKLPKLAKQLTEVEEWLAEPPPGAVVAAAQPSTQTAVSSSPTAAPAAAMQQDNAASVASTPSDSAESVR
jgi:tetratricopeptide (TPR) repeat protein